MRVVVTGGGSGGHVTPLKPIIAELKALDPSVEIMYIGQTNDPFAELIDPQSEVSEVKLINTGKYRRYPNESILERILDFQTHFMNVVDVFKILISTAKMFLYFRDNKPDIVFGNGGFVSVPVGLAASLNEVPLVIHESDARPGMASQILSKRSKRVLFGVPTRTTTLHGRPAEYVGIPLRAAFMRPQSLSMGELKSKLGFDPNKPLITVSGGSLGAEAINFAITTNLARLLEVTQVIHITGEANVEKVKVDAQQHGADARYQIVGFTDQIDTFFSASDVVVTRASATTFSELAMLGKATVQIPAKQLSDQMENAAVLSEKQVVEVIDEVALAENGDLLINRLVELLGDEDRKRLLEKNIHELAKPDAAQRLAQILYAEGGGNVTPQG